MVQNQKFKNVLVKFSLVLLMSGNISAVDWSWIPLIGGYFKTVDTVQRVAQGNLQGFGGVDFLVEPKDHSGKCALGGAAVGVMGVAAFDKFGINLGNHALPVAAGVGVASGAGGFLAGKLWFWWKWDRYDHKKDIRRLEQGLVESRQENRDLHQQAEQQRRALLFGQSELYHQGNQTQRMMSGLADLAIEGFQGNQEGIERAHEAIVQVGQEGAAQRGVIFVQINGVAQRLNLTQDQLRILQGQVGEVQAALPGLQAGSQAAQQTNALLGQLFSGQAITLPQQPAVQNTILSLEDASGEASQQAAPMAESVAAQQEGTQALPAFLTRENSQRIGLLGSSFFGGNRESNAVVLENTGAATMNDDVD